MAKGDYLKPGQRCCYCGGLITFFDVSSEDEQGHPWHFKCVKKYLKDANGDDTLKRLRKERGLRMIKVSFSDTP